MSVPPGFHPHASGLLVPDAHARKRRIITAAEWKVIEKAMGVLGFHGVLTAFRCGHGCKALEKLPQPDGGTILRCDCTDRVFQRAF